MISDPDPLVRLTQADRAAVNGLELGSDVAVSLCVGVPLSAGVSVGVGIALGGDARRRGAVCVRCT